MTSIAAVVMTSRVSAGQPSAGIMYRARCDRKRGHRRVPACRVDSVTIGGTVVGTLIIAVMNNGLQLLGVSSYWQQILKGRDHHVRLSCT
jgi:inositol transport system permease protein